MGYNILRYVYGWRRTSWTYKLGTYVSTSREMYWILCNETIKQADFKSLYFFNKSNIPEQTIRENLDKNIIEELLSTLISTRLLDLEIQTYEQKVKLRADGIIVSTSLGSTAYNYSAGGPIVQTSMDTLIITPISPFTKFPRSIVLDKESSIKIKVAKNQSISSFLFSRLEILFEF